DREVAQITLKNDREEFQKWLHEALTILRNCNCLMSDQASIQKSVETLSALSNDLSKGECLLDKAFDSECSKDFQNYKTLLEETILNVSSANALWHELFDRFSMLDLNLTENEEWIGRVLDDSSPELSLKILADNLEKLKVDLNLLKINMNEIEISCGFQQKEKAVIDKYVARHAKDLADVEDYETILIKDENLLQKSRDLLGNCSKLVEKSRNVDDCDIEKLLSELDLPADFCG
uniref:Uncharacterized protein n=1 Tax=Romanomermis culicivorax TaxID=13658 RepID=A0A915ICF7_ROMCU